MVRVRAVAARDRESDADANREPDGQARREPETAIGLRRLLRCLGSRLAEQDHEKADRTRERDDQRGDPYRARRLPARGTTDIRDLIFPPHRFAMLRVWGKPGKDRSACRLLTASWLMDRRGLARNLVAIGNVCALIAVAACHGNSAQKMVLGTSVHGPAMPHSSLPGGQRMPRAKKAAIAAIQRSPQIEKSCHQPNM